MDILPENTTQFVEAQSASNFWRILDPNVHPENWADAIQAALPQLDGLPVYQDNDRTIDVFNVIRAEDQFGSSHWQMNPVKTIYYNIIRPILPLLFKDILRTKLMSFRKVGNLLDWPIEERYVRFQFEIIHCLLKLIGKASAPFIHFWPEKKRFSFVLTHDVETEGGLKFVPRVAAIDEKYGFRSSFNFVPEGYPIDYGLIKELKARGFEVGVHGLKHDGKLYLSQSTFLKRSKRINQYLKEWQAAGFRSPMTHRNPEWMQVLEMEYDASFFDTDPFEPIPGGVLSIWPYQLGKFIELPYTLVQDHTLMVTLGETTPRIWLQKVEFLQKYYGMALVITHPDYLLQSNHLAIYEAFLEKMSTASDYWHALPRDVARWWRVRENISIQISSDGNWIIPESGFQLTVGRVHQENQETVLLFEGG